MDILQILKTNGKELLPEDLEMLRAELDTGDYDYAYKRECRALIGAIKHWIKGEDRVVTHGGKAVPDNMTMSLDKLVPPNSNGIPHVPVIPPERVVSNDLTRMRTEKEYKTLFKDYVKNSPVINEEFVEKNFTLFKDWERDAMLSCMQFSETYLDKYFDTLDHKLISLHQQFSESFFMKHYADLDVYLVLTRGVNPWRSKSHRSKQLNVFLRLKGVKV
jgi:hypothetical protein